MVSVAHLIAKAVVCECMLTCSFRFRMPGQNLEKTWLYTARAGAPPNRKEQSQEAVDSKKQWCKRRQCIVVHSLVLQSSHCPD